MRFLDSAKGLRRIIAALLTLAVAMPATAAELTSVKVALDHGRYKLESTTYFDATPTQLYNVLINYDLYTKFSSAFAEAKNLEPDEQGRPQFFSRLEGCVLLFCKSYIRYGHLELQPEGKIIAIVDPERSNFKYSQELWELVPEGNGTIMHYKFEMEPDFWVPPVVGPYFIKKSLAKGGDTAVGRIEALALGKEPEKVDD